MAAPIASIHGRFQPFHNGHLAYAKAALEQADRIYVGLTRVLSEAGPGKASAPHRLNPESNPFSYFQRVHIIGGTLLAAGVPEDRFEIGPFPIENPARLPEFWPVTLPCFTTVVDQWNEEKIDILRKLGYDVRVVKHGAFIGKEFASGTKIRGLIRAHDPSWKRFVSPAVHGLIERAFGEA